MMQRLMIPRREDIDCPRLLFPIPIFRVQDCIARLARVNERRAICPDPGVFEDISARCRIDCLKVVFAAAGAGG